jgi:aldose 1-epimerase
MVASGEQIEIAYGADRAVIATVGATLRTYTAGNRAVLDGFGADEVCPDGRGQILMPWPNRIADGRYEFAGRNHQLAIDEPALGHAIHGLARWGEWRPDHRTADRVCLVHRLCARPGYPFPLELQVEYRLSLSGLTVTYLVRNVGTTSCPFGVGAHPYFVFPHAASEEVELCVRAASFLEVDARSIPTKRCAVAGSPLDFRRPRPIGDARIDHAFTDLERDPAGVADVVLRHGSQSIRIWQDRLLAFVQVYTGDTLPNQTRRRTSVAVEPMSCAPNAFNSGDGLRILAPAETFEARWGIAVERPSEDEV